MKAAFLQVVLKFIKGSSQHLTVCKWDTEGQFYLLSLTLPGKTVGVFVQPVLQFDDNG